MDSPKAQEKKLSKSNAVATSERGKQVFLKGKREENQQEGNIIFKQGNQGQDGNSANTCQLRGFPLAGSAMSNAEEHEIKPSRLFGLRDRFLGGGSNFEVPEVLPSGSLALEKITEALMDPNISMIGVWGNDNNLGYLLKAVERRGRRDNLVIVMVSIGENPNLRTIQQQIAEKLHLSFQEGEEKTPLCGFPNGNKKALTENARQLVDRIRQETKIVVILRDLWSRLDLAKLGIPFGADHPACKLILTSHSEEILSNHMNAQRIITD